VVPIITAPATLKKDDTSDPESDELLMQVSNGTGEVTLEQYLDYFGFANTNFGDDAATSSHKSAIIAMFNERDKDGNGVLTKDEIDLRI
jgi:Ca2+-binding EF-hand superfamily protein